MTLEAVAAIKVPPGEVKAKVAPSGQRVLALDDAAAVHLGVKMTEASPEALAARLRELVGDELLARHEHPRGVPVYPASYAPDASTFDALVEELGEAADWIRVDEDAAEEDPFAAMAGLLGGAGVDLEALQQQAASGDPNALMQSAMQLAQQLADSGKLGELQEAMSGMLGGVDPRELLAQSGISAEELERRVGALDPAALEELGVDQDTLERALAESEGDPAEALRRLGLDPAATDDDDEA